MYGKWSQDLLQVHQAYMCESYWIFKVITLQNVAHVEAVIDFGEDENIEEGLLDQGCLVTQ